MTEEQKSFKKLTQKASEQILDSEATNPAILNYLGISLPGYRISPTVAKIEG